MCPLKFLLRNTTPLLQDEGNFLFSYSNGIWEIQITTQNAQAAGISGAYTNGLKNTINCKRIPDGIRYFITGAVGQANKSLMSVPQGVAEPIPFPPPDEIGLLTCWFSLCPDPDLPIISSTQARRFLSVNLFKDPNNVGEYSIAYLEPEHFFLSKFSITNDGTVFISETKQIKLGPPFQNGFEELAYEVINTTNVNGFLLPSETVFYGFAPRMKNAKTHDDVYQRAIGRLKIETIKFGSMANAKMVFVKPQNLIATDRRTPNLPDGVSAPYLVNDNQWASITNQRVAWLAAVTREHGKMVLPGERKVIRLIMLIIVAITFTAPPIWFLLIRRPNKQKQQ